jgi:hypothetical protein
MTPYLLTLLVAMTIALSELLRRGGREAQTSSVAGAVANNRGRGSEPDTRPKEHSNE